MRDAPRLGDEAEALLIDLAEASSRVPREKRGFFHTVSFQQGSYVFHNGLAGWRKDVNDADLELLDRSGYIDLRQTGEYGGRFQITPEGFALVRSRQSQAPVAAVEETIRRYLDEAGFRERHGGSLAKWREAADLYWSDVEAAQSSTIGHLCREALEAFAVEATTHHAPTAVFHGGEKDFARLKAVVAAVGDEFGERETAFLDALLNYWGTVSDLAQRQEHGASKQGTPLGPEDARRVVFQTAIVMFEVDRALMRVGQES